MKKGYEFRFTPTTIDDFRSGRVLDSVRCDAVGLSTGFHDTYDITPPEGDPNPSDWLGSLWWDIVQHIPGQARTDLVRYIAEAARGRVRKITVDTEGPVIVVVVS